ncbi:MAG: hypothetical protein PHW04_07480 [Candidatus Wallbacteria bacterium]|nr:hypothetical protein [Candidatus Wallbacteria bacterium]
MNTESSGDLTMNPETSAQNEITIPHDRFSKENCESCGRFLGPERQSCIYCGALRSSRIPVRNFYWFGYFLVCLGFFYFFLALTYKPVFIPIFSLNETMNFKRVRVKGLVTAAYTNLDKYKRNTSVSLTLRGLKTDGTVDWSDNDQNVIRLKAEGENGTALKNSGNLPKNGDLVELSASLYAGPGYRVLNLSSQQFIKIIGHTMSAGGIAYAPATVTELLANAESWRDKAVLVKKSRIVKCREKYIIEISDPDADPPQNFLVFGIKPEQYSEGDLVSVRGTFTFYSDGGYWEIKTDKGDRDAVTPWREE